MHAAKPKSVSTLLEREIKLAVEQRFRLPDLGQTIAPPCADLDILRHARLPVSLRRDNAPTSSGAGDESVETQITCGQSAPGTRSQGGTRQSAGV